MNSHGLRMSLGLLLTGILLSGCASRPETAPLTLAAESSVLLGQAAITNDLCLSPVSYPEGNSEPTDTSRSLLQILFVGLMVFEDCRDPSLCGQDEEGLYVYLPELPEGNGHEFVVAAGTGIDSRGVAATDDRTSQWRVLSQGLDILDRGILTLKTDPDIQERELFRIPWIRTPGFPPAAKYRDSAWLMKAERVGGRRQSWNYDNATFTFRIDTGCFETCSLTSDEEGRACRTKLGAIDVPVSAETMVLRQPLPPLTQKVEIGGVEIPVHSGEIVEIDNQIYDTVYNVAIAHLPPDPIFRPGPRPLVTTHSELLANMFNQARGDWSQIMSLDCIVEKDQQPACLEYFSTRFDNVIQLGGGVAISIFHSSFNRPICPLIEGP